MDSEKTTAQILAEAADLLELPNGWTQEEFFRLADGTPASGCELSNTIPEGETPACFCLYGAIGFAQGLRDIDDIRASEFDRFIDEATLLVTPESQYHGAIWNDRPERTQAEVVEALRKASELAKAAEGEAV